MTNLENKPIYSNVSLTTYFALNPWRYYFLPEIHAGALVKWLAIPSVMPEFKIRSPLSVFSVILLNVCSPLTPKVFIVWEASVAETTYMVCSISDQHLSAFCSMCLEESVIVIIIFTLRTVHTRQSHIKTNQLGSHDFR